VIADALGDEPAIDEFVKMDWEEQKKWVPGLDDGHSGNTFGGSVALARALVRAGQGQTVSV
jgi:hypothetical protein